MDSHQQSIPAAQPRTGPALASLRSATQASHEALEALLRLDQPFDLDHYRRVLQGFAAFLPPWELWVTQALPQGTRAWFAVRSRSHLVQMDLACLGADIPTALPPQLHLPTPAAAWGSMYVVEGSALGGRVIARWLGDRHGIGPHNGGAYFAGWGERTGAHWREFCQALEAALPTQAEREQACAAAVATFGTLAAVFRSILHNDEPAAA